MNNEEKQGQDKIGNEKPLGEAPTGDPTIDMDEGARKELLDSVKSSLQPRETGLSKEDLQRVSQKLKRIYPYNLEAWRLHADLLLNAIRMLQTRQMEPDDDTKLFVTPFREDQLRNAAERALRQCAHFAQSAEQKIAFVDEANQVRNVTWF
jgi:hypothetical protein